MMLSHGVSIVRVTGHEMLYESEFVPLTVTVYCDTNGVAAVPNSDAGVRSVFQKISNEGPVPG